jgi:hypothetical protein
VVAAYIKNRAYLKSMPVSVPLLPSELLQLFFVGILVAFAVLVGQALFEHANRIARRVEKQIEGRKHPDITYVLYDILWAPFTVLVVFLLIRAGMLVVPDGSVTAALTTLLDTLLVTTLLWFAIRIIRSVIQLADKETDGGAKEA